MLQALIHLLQLPKKIVDKFDKLVDKEVDKLDSNKLTNVPISLINLKTKVDDLDIDKLNIVPVDLKKLGDVVDNEVVKNTKLSALKTKVNSLEKLIANANTLIHINQ